MPFHKEPLFFGADLTRRYGALTEAEYLNLFAEAGGGQRVGEASTWYLYSRSAAREIYDFAPGAQIMVMLRNPVDVMYAQHGQLLFNQQENIADFAEALAAEPLRRQGQRLPPGPLRPENLFYRDLVRFAEQLRRYFDIFPPERVHVIVYHDFARDTAGEYRRTLKFLGVDDSFLPNFERVNAGRTVRWRRLQKAAYAPPTAIRRLAPRLRRYPFVHRLRDTIVRLNSRTAARPELNVELRGRLTRELLPEVEALEALLGRDLGAWKN